MGGGITPTFKEGLPNLYCGVGTILLGFLFLLSWDVKWKEKLCALFLLVFFNVSFIIRQLDYIWHGFHFPNMIPYRFSFLYSFVLLVVAYRAWTLRRKFDPLQVVAAGLLTAAVLCCNNDILKTQSISLFGTVREVHLYIIYNAFFFTLFFVILLFGSLKPKQKEDTPEETLRVRRATRKHYKVAKRCLCSVLALELAATLCAFGYYFPGTNVTDYPQGNGICCLHDSLYAGAGAGHPVLPGGNRSLPDPQRWCAERLQRYFRLHQLRQCPHHRVYEGAGLWSKKHL